jgi:hypothetical protein
MFDLTISIRMTSLVATNILHLLHLYVEIIVIVGIKALVSW